MHDMAAPATSVGGMLSPHAEGVVLEVWVVPGASVDEIVGPHGDALKVRTVAPPEGGKANRRIASFLAATSGASRARVISGRTSRRKRVVLEGLDISRARRWLASIE